MISCSCNSLYICSVLVCANAYIIFIIIIWLTVLVVQEVVSSDSPVLGIAVDSSNITLPAEVFTNKNGPSGCLIYTSSVLHLISVISSQGFVASYYFRSLPQPMPE